MILAPIIDHDDDVDDGDDSDDTSSMDLNKKKKTHTKKELYVSRYVNTPWTSTELQRPYTTAAIFNFDSDILEDVVGTTAINTTIHEQRSWRGSRSGRESGLVVERTTTTTTAPAVEADLPLPQAIETTTTPLLARSLKGRHQRDSGNVNVNVNDGNDGDDPYSKYARSCVHGDVRPVLPRLQVERTTTKKDVPDTNSDSDSTSTTSYSMKIDYSMLSLPERGIDDLYKLWPSMKSHLGPTFPLMGPCK